MKVIVTRRNFHDMVCWEIMPEVFFINESETPEEALRRIWEDQYNGAIADNLNEDIDDPLDEENCWIEDEIAMITWEDGDTKEFYITEVKHYI